MILIVFQLLRHSQKNYREADGAVHDDQVIDECKKNNSTILKNGQCRETRNSSMLRIGRLKMDISSGKRWRTKEKVSTLCEPNSPNQFLYLRAIQGHSRSAINLARQCIFQKVFPSIFYHVGKGKSNEVNSES